ncbi:MAG TPA: hypothetical protein VLC50_02030 [Actinomycetes bacterium]|nr:hypothetical protein [Actinomycetes bacterium]
MIVRIMGEGQYDVPGDALDDLNGLDSALEQALQTEQEAGFRAALVALLERVRAVGVRLPDESLEPSDAILPDGDASIEDVRELLGEEGLIPG